MKFALDVRIGISASSSVAEHFGEQVVIVEPLPAFIERRQKEVGVFDLGEQPPSSLLVTLL